MTLKGRRAVVTGATRGIGLAIAERLRVDGASVIMTGTKVDFAVPSGFDYRAADFSDSAALERLAADLAQYQPDILINSAGVNKLSPFGDIGDVEFDLIQRVNVKAPFRLCQAVLPGMRARRWGRVVNICSIWGKVGKELRASYATSKFALAGMTSALAAEVARDGILANCISPGPIETEMTYNNLTPPMLADLVATIPVGRLGRAEEVAALVAWLAGPENTFVTGQNIAIDGGMLRV